MTDENYRPAVIEFDVAHDGSLAPETLGTFPTAEEAAKYIGKNLVVVNQALTVSRHMDNKEKNDLRREYSDILENILPKSQPPRSMSTTTILKGIIYKS